jgi:mannan endo-1,4-beta-mannosidase
VRGVWWMAAVLVALAGVPVGGIPAHAGAATGIRVHDGRLVEADGSDLVLHGIDYEYMSYRDHDGSFPAMKAAGANAVRVPLGIGHRWRASTAGDVATVIGLCRRNRLICVLDAHDTTGFGPEPRAATIAEAVRFWLGVRAALAGQEDYTIVNIANEPFGNGTWMPWAAQTGDAIRTLRAAGIRQTLMVDAPGWGQDESYVMRDNAVRVAAADPTGDTVFDIHMYGRFDTARKVDAYLSSFTRRRLPLVVGEFSARHEWGKPDADAILAGAQAGHLGYFAWSWSGNDPLYHYLDLVDHFNAGSRTPWGQRFIAGPNGLRTGTHEATVYRDGARAPGVSEVGSRSVRLAWQRNPGPAWLTGYQVVSVDGDTERGLVSTNRSTVTLTGLRPSTEYTFAVYARDVLGHRSARSAPATVVTPPAH